ncbi:MAG: ThaI family type II restriction endonuclease [Chloroflexota bacterium]|nr:ThaI family type II restriction endonuclease [Chloroflexota bacterium]
MSSRVVEIFEDKTLIERIKKRLPYLYQIAELECSRAGHIGMEVGSVREKIIVALLIYKFGETNVNTEIPITRPEVDAEIFGQPISIKTITKQGKGFGGVKISWTVDAPKAQEFLNEYSPHCDMVLVRIVWGGNGGLYYIPRETQQDLLDRIGRENYIKLPKPSTNPRGVEIKDMALSQLVEDKDAKAISISWQKSVIDYQPYKRWVDFWREE